MPRKLKLHSGQKLTKKEVLQLPGIKDPNGEDNSNFEKLRYKIYRRFEKSTQALSGTVKFTMTEKNSWGDYKSNNKYVVRTIDEDCCTFYTCIGTGINYSSYPNQKKSLSATLAFFHV